MWPKPGRLLTIDSAGPEVQERTQNMNKYLFIYRSPNNDQASADAPSPEQMQEMLAQWANWKEKFAKHVIDMGDGLKPEGKVLANGKVTDGPFIEAKELLGGYSIVEAESYEEALSVAKACPMVHMPGASIEIRELCGY